MPGGQEGHGGARADADHESQQESLAQADGIHQRANQDGEKGHGRGPHRDDEASPGVRVAQVRGEPEHQGGVHDTVGHDGQDLGAEDDPELADRAFKDQELAEE